MVKDGPSEILWSDVFTPREEFCPQGENVLGCYSQASLPHDRVLVFIGGFQVNGLSFSTDR